MGAVKVTPEAARAELIRRAREELGRRRGTPGYVEAIQVAIRSELFARQIAVLDDPSRRISFCCSRRSGKTEWSVRAIALSLLVSGEEEFTVFGARTLGVARDLVWRRLCRLAERYNLGWKIHEGRSEISTPTGSEFRLFGVDDAVSIEKVRGKKYRLIVCDEASSYEGNLQKLIQECFSPGTMDFDPPGRIVIAGTPGYVCKGFWFDIAARPVSDGGSKAFSRHHWTLRDNPHIPNADAAIREECEAWGWTDDDPAKLRELDGRWIADGDSLVYSFDSDRNVVNELPEPFDPSTWLTTMAADIGYTDDFALVVVGSPPHSKDTFVLYAFKQSGLLVGAQADLIHKARQKYKPNKTVIDAGGQGKLTLEEFNSRYGKTAGGRASPAEKGSKVEAIGMLNSDLRTGTLKALLPDAEPFASEAMHLPWSNQERTKEHPGFSNHACFAAGTLVTTLRGDVPINEILIGDMALTRRGFRRVTHAWCSGVKSTYRMESKRGAATVSTGDHPFWSEGRWVRLLDLTPGDELTCQSLSISSAAGAATIATPSPRHETTACTGSARKKAGACARCIATSGKTTTAPSLTDGTCTTKTRTRSTTTSTTSNASPPLTTLVTTGPMRSASKRVGESSSLLSPQRGPGTAPQKGSPGTARTASALPQRESPSPTCAGRAKQSSCLCSRGHSGVPTHANRRHVEIQGSTTCPRNAPTAAAASSPTSTTPSCFALDRVASVIATGREEPVFNITVEEEHEFFANGILAKNCDAVLYSWRAHRAYKAKPAPITEKTDAQLEQEAVERRMKNERDRQARGRSSRAR